MEPLELFTAQIQIIIAIVNINNNNDDCNSNKNDSSIIHSTNHDSNYSTARLSEVSGSGRWLCSRTQTSPIPSPQNGELLSFKISGSLSSLRVGFGIQGSGWESWYLMNTLRVQLAGIQTKTKARSEKGFSHTVSTKHSDIAPPQRQLLES